MTEQELISDFNDQKLLTTQGQDSEFKLPRLDHHPARPQVRSKAEKRRNSPVLPVLKKSSQSNYDITSEVASKKSIVNQKERDDFALDIQEKLKMVLQNVKQGQNFEERSQQEQGELEFQEVIQHNKERIKQHKLQNEAKHPRRDKPHSREDKNHARQKVPKSLNKHDNLYEKRVKEMSLENKFLAKKKEIVAQKNEALEKAKLISKERDETIPQKHGSSIPFPVRIVGKSKNSPKKSPQKSPPPPPKEDHPSNNLFDNIHNLLQNPLKNRVKSSAVAHQNIKVLESKLRHLNEKLGISETIQVRINDSVSIANYTVSDWKRFVYTDSNHFRFYQDSNFEKQMEKVSKLQQKNEFYLNQYLDHQRRLVELALIKKLDAKIHQNTS